MLQSNFASYPKVLEMISRCEHMYEMVSERLLEEGKEQLYEDERLFIGMISRLNEQALDTDDGPDTERRKSTMGTANPLPAASHQPESAEMSALRSLVEQNEVHKPIHVSDFAQRTSADVTAEETVDTTAVHGDHRKRSGTDVDEAVTIAPAPKRKKDSS